MERRGGKRRERMASEGEEVLLGHELQARQQWSSSPPTPSEKARGLLSRRRLRRCNCCRLYWIGDIGVGQV